ncbi:hypothetical protein L228DRAFT_229552 [Xylona heveae TC161]|uniref:COP9 signalosome complex subunit 4 n=1 Tax=Xylona heveae (strain CBS 132557 / TC161) TaxID=1328760 RepID=A0A165HR45_XYLHT|nr:hypothetical protein L228DRAFT_229552 [Xylona heveae TC161]KZF23856.1 hypothetical protein L228DRAFT_229552 [Xylona heveae TC161]
MASTDILTALAELESSPQPQHNKASGYNELLQKIVNGPSAQLSANLIAFLDSILGETVGVVVSRQLLISLVLVLKDLPSAEVKIEVCQHALQALQPRVVSFEEQDAAIREIVADAYEQQEDYTSAAKALQGIQLDSSQRMISDTAKVKLWIRIVRLFLEEDDTTSAETYLNRAKTLLYKVEDQEIRLMFQLSQARILDAGRKFLDACRIYHEFSFSLIIAEEEKMRALSAAIICAVLGPAGPQRSRILSQLYRDERASQVEEFGILEKMFLDRLLSPAEVKQFADKLAPHQLAQTADGSTVLTKAVIEHNLLGASRLYSNIGMEDLGGLLGLEGEKAGEYAAAMIEQGRLAGRIDQIDRLIYFDGGEGSGERTSAGQADRIVGNELRKWDANVRGLTEEVEKVTTLIQNHYPDFVAANLVH